MKRVKDQRTGRVHYASPAFNGRTLCGLSAGTDLFGRSAPVGPDAHEQVDCPDCACIVCACRNEPYNTIVYSVKAGVLMRACSDAVYREGCQ